MGLGSEHPGCKLWVVVIPDWPPARRVYLHIGVQGRMDLVNAVVQEPLWDCIQPDMKVYFVVLEIMTDPIGASSHLCSVV